jgi:hypothetical protein
MFKKQFSTVILLAIIYALMGASIPTGFSTAIEDHRVFKPDCPPLNAALARNPNFIKSLHPECQATDQRVSSSTQQGVPQAQHFASSGPDDYGYTWEMTTPFWVDATGGTDAGLSGDSEGQAAGPVPIPFSFPYYENAYTSLYIASGYVAFAPDASWNTQFQIPSSAPPNGIIAPYATPMYYNSSGPAGRVYYASGGATPKRYFVVEWYDVNGGDPSDATGNDDTYREEVILFENGDFLFEYQTMTVAGWYWCGEAGMENSTGLDGLSTIDFCPAPPSSHTAVWFHRPSASARVALSPSRQGGFAAISGENAFTLTVSNNGDFGTDTYNLAASSSWAASLDQSDGITPLTDTNGDAVIDTGPIPQGGFVIIVAKFSAPGGAGVGDTNSADITATSSLNPAKSKTATISMAIPPLFAQVFSDAADGAMSFLFAGPNGLSTGKATNDKYYGADIATIELPNGNYFYTWIKINSDSFDIEFTLLNQSGSIILPTHKLTNNSGAAGTYDMSPAVAAAPNGTVGVVWTRELYNSSTHQSNYNIYFAELSSAGSLLYGPVNVTQNSTWGTYNDLNNPILYSSAIASTDDNRFLLGWQKDEEVSTDYWQLNVWNAVYNSSGAVVKSPAALTSDNISSLPVLNSLAAGKAIFTWSSGGVGFYTVMDSAGNIVKSAISLPGNAYFLDAVFLKNSKTAIAYIDGTGIRYVILNSSFAVETAVPGTPNPYSAYYNVNLSVTTDDFNHVIITWGDVFLSDFPKLFFAMGDSGGTFLIHPIPFKFSDHDILVSINGEGNAPITPRPDAFSKSAPTDGSYAITSPTLSWNPSNGADGYQYCIDTANNGMCDTAWIPTGTSTSIDLSGLANNRTYYWQVHAVNTDGYTEADEGAWWSFTARNQTFADVPIDHQFWAQIEAFYSAGITTGCGVSPLIFCPDQPVTRAAMAVFLLRTQYGSGYAPPAASHFFSDLPVAGKEWQEPWVDELYREGITGGCGTGPLIFCPENSTTRAAMAVFILRAKYGSSYTPPAASHYFADLPVAGKEWMEPWVDEFYREGITSGCGTGPLIYCPETAVKRQAMAAFIVRAFNLPLP